MIVMIGLKECMVKFFYIEKYGFEKMTMLRFKWKSFFKIFYITLSLLSLYHFYLFS